uniref:Secreted protein n=1 Tax=Strombidium rassoulzadegani TaxID=1082188 RepID=A0A7S3CRG1_9SPIT
MHLFSGLGVQIQQVLLVVLELLHELVGDEVEVLLGEGVEAVLDRVVERLPHGLGVHEAAVLRLDVLLEVANVVFHHLEQRVGLELSELVQELLGDLVLEVLGLPHVPLDTLGVRLSVVPDVLEDVDELFELQVVVEHGLHHVQPQVVLELVERAVQEVLVLARQPHHHVLLEAALQIKNLTT